MSTARTGQRRWNLHTNHWTTTWEVVCYNGPARQYICVRMNYACSGSGVISGPDLFVTAPGPAITLL